MISVFQLSVSLGGQNILNNISFVLPDKHNMVILGRSGSGKTVLIKTLLGIYTPDSGEVIIDGTDVHSSLAEDRKELKKRFAMVFQNAALLDSFTVKQNVALPLYERGQTDSEAIRDKVIACLKTVGLEHTLELYPAQLSGGMRKRIGIARALVYDPDYIVFDEPVSGLDPITSSEIIYYISQIASMEKATLITITHEIRNLEQICNQLLFLDNGNLLFYGSLAELGATSNSFIKKYMS